MGFANALSAEGMRSPAAFLGQTPRVSALSWKHEVLFVS